jgi:hypothetical protein
MAFPSNQTNPAAAIPTYAACPVPTAAARNTVATGGTAVVVVSGPVNGFYILNPLTTAGQKISGAAENLYVDLINTPNSTDAACLGTTIVLQPGQSYVSGGVPSGITVEVNAASTGHFFPCFSW